MYPLFVSSPVFFSLARGIGVNFPFWRSLVVLGVSAVAAGAFSSAPKRFEIGPAGSGVIRISLKPRLRRRLLLHRRRAPAQLYSVSFSKNLHVIWGRLPLRATGLWRARPTACVCVYAQYLQRPHTTWDTPLDASLAQACRACCTAFVILTVWW